MFNTRVTQLHTIYSISGCNVISNRCSKYLCLKCLKINRLSNYDFVSSYLRIFTDSPMSCVSFILVTYVRGDIIGGFLFSSIDRVNVVMSYLGGCPASYALATNVKAAEGADISDCFNVRWPDSASSVK